MEQAFSESIKKFLPLKPVEGNSQIASFIHLTRYSSEYYTYPWDKVVVEGLFGQFSRNDLLASEVALRHRSTVLEKTGSMPANDLIRGFLGRPQTLDAFKSWINQEFQGVAASRASSGKQNVKNRPERAAPAWRELPRRYDAGVLTFLSATAPDESGLG